MNNPLWRIAELLALALPRAEREAVLGDLLESGHSALRALSDMLRFVLRRSATRIGFPLLILPLALLLTILARDTADGVAIYLWLWTSNLDAYLLGSAGFWHGIAECAPRLLLACLSLSLWSWSSAVLASRLSRFTALLFCAILVLTAPSDRPPPSSLAVLVTSAVTTPSSTARSTDSPFPASCNASSCFFPHSPPSANPERRTHHEALPHRPLAPVVRAASSAHRRENHTRLHDPSARAQACTGLHTDG